MMLERMTTTQLLSIIKDTLMPLYLRQAAWHEGVSRWIEDKRIVNADTPHANTAYYNNPELHYHPYPVK